jgi:long-chain acyl-CoA synthetase
MKPLSFSHSACAKNANKTIMKWRTLISPATATQAAVFSPTLDASMTFAEFGRRRLNVGRALVRLENEGKLGSRASGSDSKPEYVDGANFAVGIWSVNRPEWQIVDFACHAFGLVGVALYDTLGPTVVEYVTNHAPLSVVIASADHLPTLLKNAANTPCLRYIVSMDKLPAQEATILKTWAASVGLELLLLEELESYGQEAVDIHPRPPTAQMPATISYTSGTTGMSYTYARVISLANR